MIFLAPILFTAAVKAAASRALLPTEAGSAEIATWDAELKRRSVFTARGTNAEFLQSIQDVVADLASGKINAAKGRKLLAETLDGLGYDPLAGFPGEGNEPAEPGSLRDLRSEARLDLILKTQSQQVANYAYWQQGQGEYARQHYPAWELKRIEPRAVPRGEKRLKAGLVPDPENAWPARWVRAGGTLREGRMVALKDDPIWEALGDPSLFDDGLGQPYPPFAFNSGFGVVSVSAAEAKRLGLDVMPAPAPQARTLNDGAQIDLAGIDPALAKAALEGLGAEIRDDKAVLEDALAKARKAYAEAANETAALDLLDLMLEAA